MKRIKVTFWLLGFGCGMVCMGILGTWMTLKIGVDMQKEDQEQGRVHNSLEAPRNENLEDINGKDANDKTDSLIEYAENKDNSQVKIINNNEMIVDNKEELVGGEERQNLEKNEVEEVEIEGYCEVFIPSTSGAGDICTILEKAGVVEDGKEFHNYIKAQGKQAYLKDGTFTLPKHADYKKLLTLLVA